MREPAADPIRSTRRGFLLCAAGLAIAPMVVVSKRALATPESMKAAIKRVVGEANLQNGRIKLDLPALVENGNAVPLAVSVESPMTAKDHVKAIHIFTEKNPQPNVASFHLGPRAGKANLSTRIRLADTQQVFAIAEMSDGSVWTDSIEVVITLSACLEEM
jgi:sulfur-oxidizing protein SoxY